MTEKYTCYSCGKEIGDFDEIVRIDRRSGILTDDFILAAPPKHFILCGDCDDAIMQFCQCKKKGKQQKEG